MTQQIKKMDKAVEFGAVGEGKGGSLALEADLLALNAKFEAARAGQAGAGFAVMIDRIKNLVKPVVEFTKK